MGMFEKRLGGINDASVVLSFESENYIKNRNSVHLNFVSLIFFIYLLVACRSTSIELTKILANFFNIKYKTGPKLLDETTLP